jgi:chaperonin GroEL
MGRNVIIDPFDSKLFTDIQVYPQPQITKDGVTVAKSINLLAGGAIQNIGCKLLIDAAERTNEESGDGTTTCTVIANSFLQNSQKYLVASESRNITEFRKGIRDAVAIVLGELDKMAARVTT